MHSAQILRRILCNFNLAENKYTIDPLEVGYINDTYLVTDKERPIYILQRINDSVFENVEVLMQNIALALRQLKAPDYRQVQLVRTTTGKTYLSDSSGYWRVMTFIAYSTTYSTTTDVTIAKEAGRIIGKFHLLLADEDYSDYSATIPKFHDLELRKMQFLASEGRAVEERKAAAEEAIGFTKEFLISLDDRPKTALPLRVCHNDTKLNNILFARKTQKALTLIDLDTLMPGYFYVDFGDAVRTIANTAAEDEQDHRKITFKKTLFKSFVHGLSSNGAFLRREEIDALPYGVLLMPFLHGIRALTDYLNNDIYYKTTYADQNLDRCLSLFDFTKKALDHVDFMKAILQECLEPTG